MKISSRREPALPLYNSPAPVGSHRSMNIDSVFIIGLFSALLLNFWIYCIKILLILKTVFLGAPFKIEHPPPDSLASQVPRECFPASVGSYLTHWLLGPGLKFYFLERLCQERLTMHLNHSLLHLLVLSLCEMTLTCSFSLSLPCLLI